MFDIVKAAITKWDPIGLMDFAPSDEYDRECKQILDAFESGQSMESAIYDIFHNNFGEDFQADLFECKKVALDILSSFDLAQ